MTESVAIIIGAIVGGIFGAIGAWLTHKVAEQKRADALFSNALEFMGGGTQRRNLGIAAISLYWREFPQHSQLCAEMLTGSAIYLLTESEQEGASHEVFNLHRIMTLLKDISPRLTNRACYQRLEEVIGQRLSPYEERPKRGLWVKKVELENWQHDLQRVTR